MTLTLSDDRKICVIGLGYVGFPLLNALQQYFDVVGYDISEEAVQRCKEINPKLSLSNQKTILQDCDIYIICVPTPVNKFNEIDLGAVRAAFETICEYINVGNLVILESTVSPGTTRMMSQETIEAKTSLVVGETFYLGFSPERLAPGSPDTELSEIKKLISGSCEQSIEMIRRVYEPIIKEGLYVCDTIEIAESAKLLENIQRDVNIALFNEFGSVCSSNDVDFEKVVDAAATKWNFHRYKRGLVGGHCISVDPYYFISYAEGNGLSLDLISAARRVNSGGTKKAYLQLKNKINHLNLDNPHLLFLGVAYKENVNDLRNSGSLEIAERLSLEYQNLHIYDPLVKSQVDQIRHVRVGTDLNKLKIQSFDAIIVGTAHAEIIDWIGSSFSEITSAQANAILKLTTTVSNELKGFEICL